MKKRILIVLTALMLFIMLAVSASAETTATTESKSCAQGSTVTLSVSVSSTADVTSGSVEVIYDSTKLQLVSGSWNTPGAPLINFDTTNGKGAFAFSSGSTVSGRIFSVTFKVLDGAPISDTSVQCKITLRKDLTDLPVTNTSGKISITCKHNFTKKTTDHPASAASCISGPKYYYTCSKCDAVGTTTFTQGDPGSHNFDRKVETEDYLVNPATCVDVADYYFSCECGMKGTNTFTGDASWTHNYSESLFVGTQGHWYGCFDCGAKKNYSDHTTEDGACTECHFVASGNDDTNNESNGNVNVPQDNNNSDTKSDKNDGPNVVVVAVISALGAIAVTLAVEFVVYSVMKKSKVQPEQVIDEKADDEVLESTEETDNT